MCVEGLMNGIDKMGTALPAAMDQILHGDVSRPGDAGIATAPNKYALHDIEDETAETTICMLISVILQCH